MGLFNSKTTPAEDYEYEDFTYKQLPPFPSDQHVERQETSTSDAFSRMTTLITVGVAFVAANLFLAIALKPERHKLENDAMCGVTTGGEPECYFDCISTFNLKEPSVRLIKDLSCLEDCFKDDIGKKCLRNLITDVEDKGVCNVGSNTGVNPGAGVYEANSSCTQYSPNPLQPNIISGTCGEETENALLADECRQFIRQQPPIILNTATELISSACTNTVSKDFVRVKVQYNTTTCGCTQAQFDKETLSIDKDIPSIPDKVDLPPFPWKTPWRKPGVRVTNVPLNNRTLPVEFEFAGGTVDFGLQYEFNRTRNRYSWICSLRSTDLNADHFCAVTILSVPPKPTVIVGAAHCTYLCKNGMHRVPSCCCRTDTTDCRKDIANCGTNPRVAEMEGSDSQILCGEWEIGTTPPALSGERRNIALEVLEIIRHPKFDTKEGPIAGNDIAIFKVNDEKLRESGVQKYKINPVCISEKDAKREQRMENEEKEAPFGIQAGWAEPPPFPFILKYAPAYAPLYRDFFKQWHYRMDIFEKCEDPKNSTFGELQCPSNTSYPAATICARDFAKSACFTSGESGSPLMVQDDDKIFYAKGLLSFVKGRGCDIYSNNPSAYTKLSCFLPWIAEQYDMDYEPEEENDPTCTVGTPNTVSENEKCLEPEESQPRFFDVGQKETKRKEKCQNTPSSLQEKFAGERDCIFPFYYNGRKYDKCIVFTEDGFVYPAFRCPIYNILTKRDGINNYEIEINRTATQIQNKDCPGFACQIFQTPTYCAVDASDPNSDLDPTKECDIAEKRAPFSVCKNNCPGVGALGIIGGGALAFFATAFAGQALLAPAGIGAIGLVGAGGFAGSGSQICMCPFCRSPYCCTRTTNQRCRLQRVRGRLQCPSRC